MYVNKKVTLFPLYTGVHNIEKRGRGPELHYLLDSNGSPTRSSYEEGKSHYRMYNMKNSQQRQISTDAFVQGISKNPPGILCTVLSTRVPGRSITFCSCLKRSPKMIKPYMKHPIRERKGGKKLTRSISEGIWLLSTNISRWTQRSRKSCLNSITLAQDQMRMN